MADPGRALPALDALRGRRAGLGLPPLEPGRPLRGARALWPDRLQGVCRRSRAPSGPPTASSRSWSWAWSCSWSAWPTRSGGAGRPFKKQLEGYIVWTRWNTAFELNAGRLCLDFTNTVRARPLSEKVDLIGSYEDLLSWARQATILTPGEAATLGETARRAAPRGRRRAGPGPHAPGGALRGLLRAGRGAARSSVRPSHHQQGYWQGDDPGGTEPRPPRADSSGAGPTRRSAWIGWRGGWRARPRSSSPRRI